MAAYRLKAISVRRKISSPAKSNFAPCLDAPQHLWHGGGGETDVYKGQFGEEEAHGDVEVGV